MADCALRCSSLRPARRLLPTRGAQAGCGSRPQPHVASCACIQAAWCQSGQSSVRTGRRSGPRRCAHAEATQTPVPTRLAASPDVRLQSASTHHMQFLHKHFVIRQPGGTHAPQLGRLQLAASAHVCPMGRSSHLATSAGVSRHAAASSASTAAATRRRWTCTRAC